ncbi:MAG: hypothetical protein JXR59_11730 [Desulfuromonadaceae bacterium]|nr:hypothetical protein [Desulfuromonadaceae bacterium]
MTIDLTDFEVLPIHDVAKHMAEETKIPLTAWLHRLIKSRLIVCYQHESGYGVNGAIGSMKKVEDCLYPSEDDYAIRLINLHSMFNKTEPRGPRETTKTLKEQLKDVTVSREQFRAWCEASGYDLPRFWFGECAPKKNLADQMKQLEEAARKGAEEVAASGRKKNIPPGEIVHSLQERFGLKGVQLHDAIWPELKHLTPGNKNKRLTDYRKGKQ